MTDVLFRGKPRTKRNRIAAKTCLAVPARSRHGLTACTAGRCLISR